MVACICAPDDTYAQVNEVEDFLDESAELTQFLHLLHLPLIPTVIFAPARLIELSGRIQQQSIKEQHVIATIFVVSDWDRLRTNC
jgi:hypothetical protein